jgi:hypothetical protein
VETKVSEIAMPSLAYASMPFQFWKGTIKYRFQVCSSSFHKGRLKFVWDPFGTPTIAAEYNTAYTQIVDISEANDFTIEVGWGQTTPWRQMLNLDKTVNYA